MSDRSAIEWTEATWNPVVGCDQISPGCAHCYAKTIHDRRYHSFLTGGNVLVPQYATAFEVVRPREDRLDVPLHWKKPRRIFVNSMSDLFHDDVPDAFIDQVFAVMALAPQHTFQVLTKRAERLRAYCQTIPLGFFGAFDRAAYAYGVTTHAKDWETDAPIRWPLPNVWLGVSVENQHFADERIPLLLQTPAAVRFISAEPLLEAITLRWNLVHDQGERFHWVIDGAESGHGARDYRINWSLSLQRQCEAAGVAYFRKQVGHRPIVSDLTHWRGAAEPLPDASGYRLTLRDRKGGDPAEWPADLRVREFPAIVGQPT